MAKKKVESTNNTAELLETVELVEKLNNRISQLEDNLQIVNNNVQSAWDYIDNDVTPIIKKAKDRLGL
tara:strand:+ start:256 stop:459 length:204 start_codon:yes stop_codon:yes gene_type:complete